MKEYRITVIHELGLFSSYVIKSEAEHKARKEAKQRFVNDFCGGNTIHKIITKLN